MKLLILLTVITLIASASDLFKQITDITKIDEPN